MKKLWYVVLAVVFAIGCGQMKEKEKAKPDVEPPYINLNVFEFTTVKGKPIDFSTVYAYDNHDGLLPVYLKGDIDYDKVGDYQPMVACKDQAGNESDVKVSIHVIDESKQPLTEQQSQQIENTLQETSQEPCKFMYAKDQNKPCSAILDEDVSKYSRLFFGEDAKKRCEDFAKDKGSCEVFTRNDNVEVGYGFMK